MNSEKYILKSKFEILYITKQILGFSLGIIVISLCFYNSFSIYGFNRPFFILGVVFSAFFLIIFIPFTKSLKTITLTEQGIQVCKPLLRSSIFFKYEDIDFISLARQRGVYVQGTTREITPFIGGHILAIKFKTDEEIYISPREFENFKELVDIISTRDNSS